MRLQLGKKGIRALGIAESFRKGLDDKSILAGIVMRADKIIDGFIFSSVTVGGMDSTKKIINMYKDLERDDLNIVFLNGCVISWFNVIDLRKLSEEINLPVICLTYHESEGLDEYFKELFPEDWENRIRIHHKNNSRRNIILHTGYNVYVREIGISKDEVKHILNMFTLHGAVPEPLRLARLLSRSAAKNLEIKKSQEMEM